METFDKRVDAYIEKSADFAKPILQHIRALVHRAAPGIKETIKWSFPHFDYKGTVCSMASFKQHCALGFWKSSLLADPHNLLNVNASSAMGQFGRITSVNDLPADEILIDLIQNALELNEKGIKISPKRASNSKAELEIPAEFSEALSANPRALSNFEEFSYSCKKEYLDWFSEAKTETTRQKRMTTALEWLNEGKSRNWKYERK